MFKKHVPIFCTHPFRNGIAYQGFKQLESELELRGHNSDLIKQKFRKVL
ncbi:hypothetical protein SAMN05444412_10524 [Rhodonellum ikkaensis]|uniref:Transposase n=1 Tax=Rhodonellum ikkaensis TaxID=336829 RepID=A0A1H3PUG2_9BACT|nr:hypothetical protein SAMN05444412_10524 [Rhodonellum ikkaensis]